MGSILCKSCTILLLICPHLGEVGFLHSKKKSIPGDTSRVHHNIWGSLVLFQHLKIMNSQLIKKQSSLFATSKIRNGSRQEIYRRSRGGRRGGGGGSQFGVITTVCRLSSVSQRDILNILNLRSFMSSSRTGLLICLILLPNFYPSTGTVLGSKPGERKGMRIWSAHTRDGPA